MSEALLVSRNQLFNSKERQKLKQGKECVTCRSKYDLTLQHLNEPHLNRRQKTFHQVKILCATCHFNEDQEKMLATTPQGLLKKYNDKMNKAGL